MLILLHQQKIPAWLQLQSFAFPSVFPELHSIFLHITDNCKGFCHLGKWGLTFTICSWFYIQPPPPLTAVPDLTFLLLDIQIKVFDTMYYKQYIYFKQSTRTDWPTNMSLRWLKVLMPWSCACHSVQWQITCCYGVCKCQWIDRLVLHALLQHNSLS